MPEVTSLGTPDLIPVLSKGKHRSPRKGACFMEYASFLAGERWSDHPTCTHPLLAGAARDVNDHMSDEGRARLVRLIPTVVGLQGEDPILDIAIATRCAALALPVSAHFRQRALAAGLLTGRSLLIDARRHGADLAELAAQADQALAMTPHATRWAEEFVVGIEVTPEVFQRRSAPSIVRVAVSGIAEACISDRDGLLYELLSTVIDDFSRWTAMELNSPVLWDTPTPSDLLGHSIR